MPREASRRPRSRHPSRATSRRNELARELRASLPNTADRAGLEARLQVLDQRIVQIEADIAETGRLMAMAPQARAAAATAPARAPRDAPRPSRDRAPLAMAFALALLLPIAIGLGRMFWRAGPPRPATAPVDRESRERLARLETAVDAIAIEMERVAEGQRFVTKLLADSAAQPVVADAARRLARHVPAEPGQR